MTSENRLAESSNRSLVFAFSLFAKRGEQAAVRASTNVTRRMDLWYRAAHPRPREIRRRDPIGCLVIYNPGSMVSRFDKQVNDGEQDEPREKKKKKKKKK